MSFIQMSGSFSNVQEKKPVSVGVYDLLIENAEEHTSSQSGKTSIKVTISIEGHEEAQRIIHYLGLPQADDDAVKVGNKMLMIKRFLETFGIPYEDSGFAIEDFYGARGSSPLGLTDPDDDPNGNVYNRLNLPKLEDEGVVTKKVAGRKS